MARLDPGGDISGTFVQLTVVTKGLESNPSLVVSSNQSERTIVFVGFLIARPKRLSMPDRAWPSGSLNVLKQAFELYESVPNVNRASGATVGDGVGFGDNVETIVGVGCGDRLGRRVAWGGVADEQPMSASEAAIARMSAFTDDPRSGGG